ncbi:dioxygenase family protein [Virgisporangium aurantiacum]|uniref:6-chlorohydroxyquinol-1,2-dioxygenase n=1 Tax=Virgisporangium aurantiacum TaxID=175570 RepID=A0A8J3ZC26_9ACTN|nr:dioxygenase [Virgisporangium aurantiacum]GIJ61127.1 6-chlorohydroxyquinol-1,2-dioxygenase [Virgisporangium aurantiacum]
MDVDEADLTAAVLKQLAGTPDPRVRQLMEALVRHLHAFAREVRLTGDEWMAAIQFLTATGQICGPTRQEFILLSDTLGLSALVSTIAQDRDDEGATEETILGPFYVPDSPWREAGESMVTHEGTTGQPVHLRGRVLATDGTPLAGAVLDLWQTDEHGNYAVKRPDLMPADNLRGRYRTDAEGRYSVRTIRPKYYHVNSDGPAGALLRLTGRTPGRPAHIHVIVTADGHRPVTTHLFDRASEYLDNDSVFGVKDSLIKDFVEQPDGTSVVEHDFILRSS